MRTREKKGGVISWHITMDAADVHKRKLVLKMGLSIEGDIDQGNATTCLIQSFIINNLCSFCLVFWVMLSNVFLEGKS